AHTDLKLVNCGAPPVKAIAARLNVPPVDEASTVKAPQLSICNPYCEGPPVDGVSVGVGAYDCPWIDTVRILPEPLATPMPILFPSNLLFEMSQPQETTLP